MNDTPALGCALYFDSELSSDVTPLGNLLRSIFGEASPDGQVTQWTTPEKTQQVGAPMAYDLATLSTQIRSGALASAAVETWAGTPEARRTLVLAQTTPAAQLRPGVPPRSWRYDLVAAFGGESLRQLGAAHVIDLLVTFAEGVQAKAGVIHWAETSSYAAGLAMGAGGGLTAAQEARVADCRYFRTHWGRIIRGPAWGTFLSAQHVATLGGIEALKAHSGCARVETLPSGGAFLQLTPIDAPLIEDHAEAGPLAALGQFLSPVMGQAAP